MKKIKYLNLCLMGALVEAIFIGKNYGTEYNCSGILTIKIPIGCDIRIEETES